MKTKLLVLFLGFVLGLAVAQVVPRFWQRLAPPALRGEPTVGRVEAKGWEKDRLLLTLVTDSGALLATFGRKVSEIDLLVDEGDTVALALRGYRPFVEDPVIRQVVKRLAPADAAPAETGPPDAAAAGAPPPPPPAAEPTDVDEAPPGAVEPPGASEDQPPAAGVGRTP